LTVNDGIVSGALNLASSDFELFGLSPRFQLDTSQLDQQWKQLQRQVHPDQVASQGAADKRLAMQWSVRVNEAYQRLKNPLRRAAYLCELHGAPIRAEDNTAMPAAFLMQQMQWREDLDEATEASAIEVLQQQLLMEKKSLLQQCADAIDSHADWTNAAQTVRALMFIERFEQDLDNRLERLDNN
jgi:molecular chaperone HscB